MPKQIEYFTNERGQREGRVVGQDEDLVAKAKAQDASGLGSKVKSDAFVPPKMEPVEDSAAYSARVARARAVHNQKKAMK